MQVKDLLRDLAVEWHAGQEIEVTHLSDKSEACRAGSLFFAIRGEHCDGNCFAAQAIANGAVAVVSEFALGDQIPYIRVEDVRRAMGLVAARFYNTPADKLKMVAVVGTNGKTTITHMLVHLLQAAGKHAAGIGTAGVYYDGQWEESVLTTPDPIELHAILHRLLQRGARYVVMEVSAHAIYYHKTAGIRFDLAVFTNLSRDHLDFFHDMARYAAVKQSFFTPENVRFALVNVDDGVGAQIARNNAVFHASYGIHNPSDVFCAEYDVRCGTHCLINCFDEILELQTQFSGEFNLYNTLAAVGAARALSVTGDTIATAFAHMPLPAGRFEMLRAKNGKRVVIDYAHTPDGLENVLRAARPLTQGKLIVVFGCGGNRDRGKRAPMGRIAGELADFVIVTEDNSREENTVDIAAEIERGLQPTGTPHLTINERENAIFYAVSLATKEDLVVLAGKGAETYIEKKGIKRAYSDKQVVSDVFGRFCV